LIRLGSLFLTLPTRGLTGQAIIPSVGYGASRALSWVPSADPCYQTGHISGHSWCSPQMSRWASPVRPRALSVHRPRAALVSSTNASAALRGASFPVVRPGALRLGLRLGHVTAVFGLAIPTVTGAVIDLAGGIDPDLISAATGARGAALARCARRERCSDWAGCCRGCTP